MRYVSNAHTLTYHTPSHYTQPVADQPFTFETELDDLPKDKLKCKWHFYLWLWWLCVYIADMIFEEAVKFVSCVVCVYVP